MQYHAIQQEECKTLNLCLYIGGAHFYLECWQALSQMEISSPYL